MRNFLDEGADVKGLVELKHVLSGLRQSSHTRGGRRNFQKLGVALFEKKGCAKEKKILPKKKGGGNREA